MIYTRIPFKHSLLLWELILKREGCREYFSINIKYLIYHWVVNFPDKLLIMVIVVNSFTFYATSNCFWADTAQLLMELFKGWAPHTLAPTPAPWAWLDCRPAEGCVCESLSCCWHLANAIKISLSCGSLGKGCGCSWGWDWDWVWRCCWSEGRGKWAASWGRWRRFPQTGTPRQCSDKIENAAPRPAQCSAASSPSCCSSLYPINSTICWCVNLQPKQPRLNNNNKSNNNKENNADAVVVVVQSSCSCAGSKDLCGIWA